MSSQTTSFASPSRGEDHRVYAWVIVIACTLMMAVTYGLMYSFSVFFKPLAETFSWDRATVSLIYSISLVVRGGISIITGWLADRYGAKKLMVFCGLMIGLGLILSSRVTSLWQILLSYSLIEAIGLSGTFGITTAVTSRWFTKNRGLALGLVSSGVGIGTLFMVPGAERLIDAVSWPNTFVVFGIISGLVVTIGAFFLKAPPVRPVTVIPEVVPDSDSAPVKRAPAPAHDMSLKEAITNPRMIMVFLTFALLIFCTQMVMVHLVNYATDLGINSLVAASLVSIIGMISIAGRMVMGFGSDKLGMYNVLILVCGLATSSMLVLIFARQMWAFYFFAIFFGFAYGGEVPQIPLFVSAIGGTRALATLIGVTLFIGNIGGALGPWVGGKLFDLTGNYHLSFIVGAAGALVGFILTFVLKYQHRRDLSRS